MTRKLSDLTKDLKKLNQLITLRENFTNRAKHNIGIDNIDKGRLKPSFMPDDNEPKMYGLPYERNTYSHTQIPFINIKTFKYVRDTKIDIGGVNRHVDNEFLYLSVVPGYIDSHISDVFIKDTKTAPEEEEVATGNICRLITRIETLHKNTKTTFVVLGNKDKQENTQGYKKLWRKDKDFTVHNVDKYEVNTPNNKPVDLYYFHAHDHKIDLDYQGVKTLFMLYQNGIAKEQPVLIHCQQGLDRTCEIALAYEVLRNYNTIFSTNNVLDIGTALKDAHEALCRSRSVEALSSVIDFEQAIVLAISFKACELENEAEQLLIEHTKTLEAKKISKHSKLGPVISNVQNAKSLEEKIEFLSVAIEDNELNQHHDYTFLSYLPMFIQNLRSDPEAIGFLKAWREALKQRMSIEEKLLTFGNANKMEDKEELIQVM